MAQFHTGPNNRDDTAQWNHEGRLVNQDLENLGERFGGPDAMRNTSRGVDVAALRDEFTRRPLGPTTSPVVSPAAQAFDDSRYGRDF